MAREDDDAGPTLLVIAIVVLILVLTTSTLRVFVRITRSNLGGDDYTIAAASLLTIGRVTCQIISVQHGNGRHREFIAKADYEYINFLTWLTQLFLFPILCLLKISVCLLVLRIKHTKPLRYGLWALIVLLILTTMLPDIVLLAECSPVSAYWKSQHDKCWNANVRIYSIYLQTSVSVFADVVCTLLPIAVVWNLSLSIKKKVAVCALMGLGVISTIFACVRASSLGLAVSDLSWVYCWAAIWGDLELGFGILGANLALSRTYYDFFKRGLDSISSRTNTTDHFHMPNRASYTLHSVSKGSKNSNKNSADAKNSKNSNKSSSSNPLSNTTLTNNTSSTTWDGSQAPNKSSQVQIHGRRRRNSTSSGSGDSDEVPLGKEMGLGLGGGGLNGGIERRIEISVEESGADSRAGSSAGVGAGGIGGGMVVHHGGGWGRDLERDGADVVGEGREVRAGRGV